MLCQALEGKRGRFRDLGLCGKAELLCVEDGNGVGKALRAQLGREKAILLFCRSSVVRAGVGG